MGQSLQDQLIGSGLVNKKQARKAAQDKKQQSQRKKKNKGGKPDNTPSEQQQIAREAAKAAETKRAQDKAQSEKANAERAEREAKAAAEQLIDRHRVAREPAPEDDPPYSYTMNGHIRRLPVSRNQRTRIANGRLAIVARGEQVFLIERRIAERLLEKIPERVCMVELAGEPETDPDDPYAGYEVPDDLMW